MHVTPPPCACSALTSTPISLACSCNFGFTVDGETVSQDFKGDILPGDCALLSVDLEALVLLTDDSSTPWDFGYPGNSDSPTPSPTPPSSGERA
jgi:hypothetical protein